MDSHNAIRAAQMHLGLLPRAGDVTISPHRTLTDEELETARHQYAAELDADREFAAEARLRYGSESVAIDKALSELDLALAVHALALSPGAVGGRFSHEQADDHTRLAHLHVSAARAMERDRRSMVTDTTPEVFEIEKARWWHLPLAMLGIYGGRSRW